MKRLVITAAILMLMACSSAAERQQREMMKEVEQRAKLPKGAEKLEKYARYYAMDGSRVEAIYITFVDPQSKQYDLPVGQQRWVEDYRNLPSVNDGGCSVVNVVYNPAAEKVEQAFCNGDA